MMRGADNETDATFSESFCLNKKYVITAIFQTVQEKSLKVDDNSKKYGGKDD